MSKRVLNLRSPSRGMVAVLVTILGVAAVAVPNAAVQTVERPNYLATAILRDGRDVNVRVYADRTAVDTPAYDETGHAALPFWKATLPVVPGQIVPAAPRMGWDVGWFADIGRGLRPVRYCVGERVQFDAESGDHTAALGRQAVQQVFAPFAVRLMETCDRPDLVFGATAERDCGSPQAMGCAALWFDTDGRSFVRVTFNGADRRAGWTPDRCILSIDWHELKHAADLGHTGEYGGEGRDHPHPSDLGYIGGDCRPVDNPQDVPAIDDWLDAAGHSYVWNLAPAPTPTPIPTPTPQPTPRPIDPLSWQVGFQAGFVVAWESGFLTGYCAALPEHPGCTE